MNTKGANTLSGVFWTIIFIMIMFFGLFGYLSINYESAGVSETMGSEINDSISYWNNNLTTHVDDIRDDTRDISEADGNIVQVAWNGLTGLASTFKVFFTTVIIAVGIWDAVFPGLDFIPVWFKLLVEAGIVITIVLVILGAFKGEAKT